MSFSYDNTLASDSDKVRFYIFDTDSASYKIEDEEITATLTDYPNPIQAAIVICETLAAKYATSANTKVGDVSVGDIGKAYRDQAQTLRARLARGAGVYAGGMSESEKDADALDTDLVQTVFTRETIDDD